jgi:hypothetical protein
MTLTPEQQHKTWDELISWAVCGDADAAAFCMMVCSIAQLWDDLIDKDKPIDPEHINRGFWIALVELPRNRFYQRHFEDLNPLWMVTIQNWHAANYMEAGGTEAELEIAFIIRSACADIVIQAALLVGGYEWARKVTPTIHRISHAEGLDGYKANLAKQFADAAFLKAEQVDEAADPLSGM